MPARHDWSHFESVCRQSIRAERRFQNGTQILRIIPPAVSEGSWAKRSSQTRRTVPEKNFRIRKYDAPALSESAGILPRGSYVCRNSLLGCTCDTPFVSSRGAFNAGLLPQLDGLNRPSGAVGRACAFLRSIPGTGRKSGARQTRHVEVAFVRPRRGAICNREKLRRSSGIPQELPTAPLSSAPRTPGGAKHSANPARHRPAAQITVL